MKRVLVVAAVAGVVGGVFYLRSGSADALQYVHSWPQAKEKARSEGKPILLYFSSPT